MKVAAFAVAALATAAQALVPLNQGGKVVADQYIVVLKDGADVSRHMSALATFMASEGSSNELIHEYSIDSFKGYAIRCSERVLNFIREAEDVVSLVEEDQLVSIYDVQNNPPSWGLDRVDQRSGLNRAYEYPSSAGSGVNMYTIDTGIQITHNDFTGRARWGYNAVSGSSDTDKNGHGTHCSGTMAGSSYGIAKKANIYAVKVLGDNGSGSNAGVIAGVDWVASQHGAGKKTVGNMSLGGGASSALDSAVNSAVNKGVHMAVAAGNDNRDACNYSPARAANAVTVGSTDSSDRKSSFSNHGRCVDIHAPGSSITSAWIGADSASRSISGTSMAAPHVAGVMALYLAEGKQPTASALQGAATRNAISGLPSGTVDYFLYTSSSLDLEDMPKIYF